MPPPLAERVLFRAFRIHPDADRLRFVYEVPGVGPFHHSLRVDLRPLREGRVDAETLVPVVRDLGIALAPYVMLPFGARRLEVLAAPLDEASRAFWEFVLDQGLVEFHYVAGLDYGDGVRVLAPPGDPLPLAPTDPSPTPRVLAGLGCGKDSAVLWDELGKRGVYRRWLYFAERPGEFHGSWRYPAFVRASGEQPSRVLLVEQDYLDEAAVLARGPLAHAEPLQYVLYPSLVGLSGVLAALLWGFDHVAVGNEHSANFPNLVYQGRVVNHQFEKSQDFETRFRAHVRTRLASGVTYFSGLQDRWEVSIAQRFASLAGYHAVFMSCNQPVGSRWCGRCPKCAFTWLLLAAFLDPPAARGVFGDDLFEDPELQPVFDGVLGQGPIKPLECVGEPAEAAACLALAAERWRRHDPEHQALLFRRHPELLDRSASELPFLGPVPTAGLPPWW